MNVAFAGRRNYHICLINLNKFMSIWLRVGKSFLFNNLLFDNTTYFSSNGVSHTFTHTHTRREKYDMPSQSATKPVEFEEISADIDEKLKPVIASYAAEGMELHGENDRVSYLLETVDLIMREWKWCISLIDVVWNGTAWAWMKSFQWLYLIQIPKRVSLSARSSSSRLSIISLGFLKSILNIYAY